MIPYYEKRNNEFVSSIGSLKSFPPHLHEHLEILSVQSGTACIVINGEELHLAPNDFAIAFPNTIHSYLYASDDCRTRMFICSPSFMGEYLKELLQYQPVSALICARKVHPDIAYAIEALAQESAAPACSAAVQKALLQLILARVLVQLPLKKATLPVENSLVHQVILYACDHFQEPLSLSVLASALGASKYDISRIFSKKIGVPFHHYINNLRINHARQLLIEGNLSMLEISNACGFDTQRSFNRAFKSICSVTPRAYRTTHLT